MLIHDRSSFMSIDCCKVDTWRTQVLLDEPRSQDRARVLEVALVAIAGVDAAKRARVYCVALDAPPAASPGDYLTRASPRLDVAWPCCITHNPWAAPQNWSFIPALVHPAGPGYSDFPAGDRITWDVASSVGLL